MPKLPLDPDRLRQLPGLAITALRHPRRTATQAVSGTITIVGALVPRRQADEPVPGATTTKPEPPPTDVAAEPVGPAAEAPATPTEAPPTEEPTGAPPTEVPTEAPPTGSAEASAAATEAPTEASGEPAPSPTGPAVDDESDDHLSGPVPHMPPSIAHEVERDFGEDLPGVSGERGR